MDCVINLGRVLIVHHLIHDDKLSLILHDNIMPSQAHIPSLFTSSKCAIASSGTVAAET